VFKKEDIDLFASEEEIKEANFMLIWSIYHILTPYFILKSKSFYAFASAWLCMEAALFDSSD
jgi:hypothetical protein